MNRDLISALAGALTPTTLAAVVSDLNGQGDLAQVAQAFAHQLNCLVGEEEAAKLIAEASDPTIWPDDE